MDQHRDRGAQSIRAALNSGVSRLSANTSEREERNATMATMTAPGPHNVRIRVQACGVCYSDAATVQGQYPGISYPRVPGHEVIGEIDAIRLWRLDRTRPGFGQ